MEGKEIKGQGERKIKGEKEERKINRREKIIDQRVTY